jgi:hypothetical protein
MDRLQDVYLTSWEPGSGVLEAVSEVRRENPPVFVVGPARSGTSLLYKSLCLHDDVAYVSNWVHRFPMAPQLAVLNRLPRRLPAVRRSVWFTSSNAYVYGSRRSLLHRLWPMPVEGEPVYRCCNISDRPAWPLGDEDLPRLRRIFEGVRRASGGRVLVLKRIANNLRIPLLINAFPDAKFVFLLRDGRAVAYSLSRVDWWGDSVVWWYGRTPRDWASEGRDPWELCARNWVEELRAIERGLQVVPMRQRMDIRYEQMVDRPRETLDAVADFAGLAPDGRWHDELRRLRFPDRNETWRDALRPEVVEQISAWQRDDLRRMGYQTKPSRVRPSRS